MNTMITRRRLVSVLSLGAVAATFFAGAAAAQTPVTLEDLRESGVVRIGFANQPPYSGLNPDGTISGFVPTLVSTIMERLGVAQVEPYVATYGELIPGLQARRWHMIAASFRLTPERCKQVLFTDPVTFDGGAMAYNPENVSDAPENLAALGESELSVGVLQGSYLVERTQEYGMGSDRVSQFPNNPALIDGMMAGRADVAVSTNASLSRLQEQRDGAFEIIFPIPEDPPVGSAPAFNALDAELHAAFQEELRAMRQSGELNELAAEFGFSPPPDELSGISAEDACSRLES